MRQHSRLAVGAGLTLALVATTLTTTTTATADDAPAPVTAEALTDASATQQRWLSTPGSRVVLNPYNFDSSGSEVEQSSSPALPLSNGYYAHDVAIRTADVLQTYRAPANAPASGEGEVSTAFASSFDSIDGWTPSDVSTSVTDGLLTIAPTLAKGWGSIYSPEQTVDVTAYSKLTITVPATTGKWALKVNTTGIGTADLITLQNDTDQTGTFTYDLAAKFAEQGRSGSQTFRLRLFVSQGQDKTATYDSLSIHTPATEFPDAGEQVAFADDFSDGSPWTRNSGGTTISSNGEVGTITHPGDTWGYVARQVTIPDVAATPLLSVRVLGGTGKWALKVNPASLASGDDIPLEGDTTASGVLTYDLAGTTGWTGSKTFWIKIFQVGKGTSGTSTLWDRLSIHSGQSWLRPADDYSTTSNPARLSFTASYGDAGADGGITGVEQFSAQDPNAYTRTITSDLTSGRPVVAGTFTDGTTYDAETHTIVVPRGKASYAVAVPADAPVAFFPSRSALLFGQESSSTPTSGGGYWAATLPDDATSSVGVGWAVTDDSDAAAAPAAATSSAVGAISDGAVTAASTHWTSFWDAYLAKVPTVQDYSIQRVATGGVTAEQMEHFYYQAFVGLEMNVLPATPETGNAFAQLGTGKPSLWMNGTPGTKNVASWDSLLGMQQLVYTDPENAWASFEGMMALVEDDPSATAPSDDNPYGTLGELGGESLPSRKAQTAWILYQVTGDEAKLRDVYDDLKLHLAWEKFNMRWVLHSHNYLDERDSEFVASLIYDLRFAVKIAALLGHDDDATTWAGWVPELTDDYEDWFFPTTTDGSGKVWPTVQKVYLDAGRSSSPSADQGDGAVYRNELGQWVDPGWSFYTSTALVLDQLDAPSEAKVRQRFLADYDPDKQLAGLGRFAVKAPDIQLITYGLLDSGDAGDTDKADVVINSMTRDMVVSGWFAEVYQQTTGTIGDPVIARGVRPSLFGISNYIDNLWMANGFRVDLGDPGFLRMPSSTGGVDGLTFQGKSYALDLTGNAATISGPAVDAGLLPSSIDVSTAGATVTPTVTPPASSDATLSSISVAGKPLAGFAPSTHAYSQELAAGAPVPVVAAVATDDGAHVTITPAASVPGTTTITVTAEDGTTGTYTIAFSARASGVSSLSSIRVGGTALAGFTPTKHTYTLTLPAGTTKAPTVTVTTTDPGAKATITNPTRLPGTTTITVTAPDTTRTTYTLAFTLKAPATTTIKATTTTTTYGKAAKITATLTAGTTRPTGKLTATENGKTLATTTVTTGRTTLTLPTTLKVATHKITLTFTPTTTTTTSAKTTIKVKVTKTHPKLAKITTSKKLIKGHKATIKISLRPTAGAKPTGKITITAGGTKIGTATLKKTGTTWTATITTHKLPTTGKITATYTGNTTYTRTTWTTTHKITKK